MRCFFFTLSLKLNQLHSLKVKPSLTNKFLVLLTNKGAKGTPEMMSKRILVVEDDNSIRELLVELLQSEGYEVASAINGLEGLKYLQSQSNPDLILIDLMMPIMDGYTFRTEQMKNALWSKIPVVVMSAEANAKEKLKNYGITAFLSKPVELDTILKTVELYS